MENLPTCGNCHSFSRDGKTLGMDLDGPKNDKGLYAIAPISKNMTIRNQDVIRWSSFQENPDARSSDPSTSTAKHWRSIRILLPHGMTTSPCR